jgi:hypothetical protein
VLFAVGGALAIAQPGDLDDEDETAAPAQETTTTTAGTDLTTTTTIAVTPTVPGETTTTMSGSGLGEGTPPSGGTDGVANTGAESMLGAGMALGALGLLLRRATRAA